MRSLTLFAALVAVVGAFVLFAEDSGVRSLSSSEMAQIHGAALPQGGTSTGGTSTAPTSWKFGECNMAGFNCTDANPTPPCGIVINSVCVPVVSACLHGNGCRNPLIVVSRCEGIFGICDTQVLAKINCPGAFTWGECVNPTGGKECKCVDTGVASPTKCKSIQGEC